MSVINKNEEVDKSAHNSPPQNDVLLSDITLHFSPSDKEDDVNNERTIQNELYHTKLMQINNRINDLEELVAKNTIPGNTQHLLYAFGGFVLSCLFAGIAYFVHSHIIQDLLIGAAIAVFVPSLLTITLERYWHRQLAMLVMHNMKPLIEDVKKVPNQLGIEMQPHVDRMNTLTDRMQSFSNRYEAFERLGLHNCHVKRDEALERFCNHAREVVQKPIPNDHNDDTTSEHTINIVSSSAKGLLGMLDIGHRPSSIGKDWRNLVISCPKHFRLLLTHPAFAHLREAAEDRIPGSIELEVLKSIFYLFEKCSMNSNQLRLYRGSPTVFAIQAGKHFLLNPYPYGWTAMETLCLEFDCTGKYTYVSEFFSKHFHNTWGMYNQESRVIDGKPLVIGVDSIEDIKNIFKECVQLEPSNKLRFSRGQVIDFDKYISNLTGGKYKDLFEELVKTEQMKYRED